MRAIERRLEALEATRADERTRLMVVTWAGKPEPVGICGVPGRLPEVARLPGESLDALVARASELVRGEPLPVLTFALYRTAEG